MKIKTKDKKPWNYDWIDFHLYAEHIDDFLSDLEMELSSIPDDVHCPERKRHLRKQIKEVKELIELDYKWIDNDPDIDEIIGYTDDEYIERHYPFCFTFYEDEVCGYDVDIVFENTTTFKDLFKDISETYKKQNRLRTPGDFVEGWLKAGKHVGTWDWETKEVIK